MFPTMSLDGALAQQIKRTGSFQLDCDADTAFPLFSPEGERAWVSDWDPRAVFPDQVAFARDTVFCQGKGADEALWTIIDVDWQAHRAEYVRFAPGSHSAHIVVRVEPEGSSQSCIVVSYAVTAFGDDGGRLLDAFSEAAYAAKMRDWKQRITACLERR